LASNCLELCLPEQYLPESIQELIQNYREKAGHGGITKASNIHYQGKGRSSGFGFNDSGVVLTFLRMQKATASCYWIAESRNQCFLPNPEINNFDDYVSYLQCQRKT
jgi:hypothetical protein